jgi:Fic family protein
MILYHDPEMHDTCYTFKQMTDEANIKLQFDNIGSVIRYIMPSEGWIRYDLRAVLPELVAAKAAISSLRSTPFYREWVEKLQEIQLKMEVAGTSRIEGADFTEKELEEAINPNAGPSELLTRSQRQARSAVLTYRWIANLPKDRPISEELIKEIHARIVLGCDDDHCPPGQYRQRDQNVTFGTPRHRGCEGGEPCRLALQNLVHAARREFPEHDPLIQALALHYHIAAMHPFLDGNGRTARAVEALFLYQSGLSDTAFIAMSNYYYEEKPQYLAKLSEVRAENYDLTSFLVFGLRGVELQCRRLFAEIRKNIQKALFRNTMYDLFNRLESKRKRVIKERQIELLKILLAAEQMDWNEFVKASSRHYSGLKNWTTALSRDVNGLLTLKTVSIEKVAENKWTITLRLEWPSEITESRFMELVRQMPKAKTYGFLS